MSEGKQAKRDRPPVWAMALAALLLGGGIWLWVPTAIEHASAAQGGDTMENVVGLLSNLYVSLAILPVFLWAMLLFFSRGRIDPARAIVSLMLLAAVSVVGNVWMSVHAAAHVAAERTARIEAEAAADRKALDAAVNGWAAPEDRALAAKAITRVRRQLQKPPARRFRALKMSQVAGTRALCGETSDMGPLWIGFVAWQDKNGDTWLEVEHDAFTPEQQAVCEPLVLKYLGEPHVDYFEADAAFGKARCNKLDSVYWEARKRYCHGKITLPVRP